MKSKVLATVLTIGWLLGYLPIGNAWKPGQLTFRWCSWSTAYSLIVLVLVIPLQVDLERRFVTLFTDSNAEYVLGATRLVTDAIHPLSVRLVYLMYCPSFVRVLNGVVHLLQDSQRRPVPEAVVAGNNDFSSNNSDKLVATANSVAAEATSTGPMAGRGTKGAALENEVSSGCKRSWHHHHSLFFYLPLAAMTTGQAVSLSDLFSSLLVPAAVNGTGFGTYYECITPNWAPLRLFVSSIAAFNGVTSVFYALWLSVSLGVTLLKAHQKLVHTLLSYVQGTSDGYHGIPAGATSAAAEIFDNFVQLKECFRVCGEVIGLCLLVTFAWILAGMVYCIHALIWPRIGVSELADLVLAVLALVTLVLMGQKLQMQVSRMAEELKDKLVAVEIKKTPVAYEVVKVAEAVVEWKWELTAGGMFPIDNTCFATLLGALVTGAVFVVQLELSETTFKSPVLPSDCGCNNRTF